MTPARGETQIDPRLPKSAKEVPALGGSEGPIPKTPLPRTGPQPLSTRRLAQRAADSRDLTRGGRQPCSNFLSMVSRLFDRSFSVAGPR